MPKIILTITGALAIAATAFSIGALYADGSLPHSRINIPRTPFVWLGDTYAERYSQTLEQPWEQFAMEPMAGFAGGFVLKQSPTCLHQPVNFDNFLKADGGMCVIGYWLEDANGNKITTTAELKKRFTPLKDARAAASYVSATQLVAPPENGVTVAFKTAAIPGGYLVQTRFRNFCNDTEDYRVIYEVKNNGDVALVANVPRTTPICTP